MGRSRNGAVKYVNGVPYARVRWTDEHGKRKEKMKKADNASHANLLIKQMLRELDDYGLESLDAERMTFADLADYYRTHHLIPAKYVDGRKITGLRSLHSTVTRWTCAKEYFGKKRLRSITYGDLARFRSDRINTMTIHNKPRSITSVNRELETLRNMLNIAQREGWLLRNPFTSGPSLIQKAHEKKRERILTLEEEGRLLAACTGRRSHLIPILIMALDTGMRRGEILTLTWRDIDFESKVIAIRAFNTKTQRERMIGMTPRIAQELLNLYSPELHQSDERIFGIIDNVKKSFTSACRAASIEGLRLHDCRHTFATRLIEAGVPQAEVSRLLGHANTSMTDRYINADVTTARRAMEALTALLEKKGEDQITLSVH
ncbi:MAG: site-specific integrase [Blastocatellia bacterium]